MATARSPCASTVPTRARTSPRRTPTSSRRPQVGIAGRARRSAQFLCYAVSKGQEIGPQLRYARLSTVLVNLAISEIVKIPGAPSAAACAVAGSAPPPPSAGHRRRRRWWRTGRRWQRGRRNRWPGGTGGPGGVFGSEWRRRERARARRWRRTARAAPGPRRSEAGKGGPGSNELVGGPTTTISPSSPARLAR